MVLDHIYIYIYIYIYIVDFKSDDLFDYKDIYRTKKQLYKLSYSIRNNVVYYFNSINIILFKTI